MKPPKYATSKLLLIIHNYTNITCDSTHFLLRMRVKMDCYYYQRHIEYSIQFCNNFSIPFVAKYKCQIQINIAGGLFTYYYVYMYTISYITMSLNDLITILYIIMYNYLYDICIIWICVCMCVMYPYIITIVHTICIYSMVD